MKTNTKNHIVVFGKGGVGKSTFASNLSAYYASLGMNVLHIGCDPKSDSTLFLLENMNDLTTVMSWISNDGNDREPGTVFNKGRLGIKCIEAGGPEAGIGCGGRGIARVMEYLETWKVMEMDAFDVVIFDVLGDVVCGGFAAPLRKGFGNKVVIVIAEDEMSYFAANNIAKAILRYSVNGVSMAGLVVNERGGGGPKLRAAGFAELIRARILGTLPVSETPALARNQGLTAMEYDPGSSFSVEVASIAEKLLSLDSSATPLPLDQKAFMQFLINPEDPAIMNSPDNQELPDPAVEDTLAAKPENPPHSFEHERINNAFSLLLGFKGKSAAGPEMNIDFVKKIPEGGIRLGFSGLSVGKAEVSLTRNKEDGTPVITGGRFDIFLDAGKISAPMVRILRKISHRLGDFSLLDIESIYDKCLEDWVEPEPEGPAEALPGSISSDKWACFFARGQIARNMGQNLFYNIPVSQISHRDVECAYATPPIRSDEFIPYNYPWLSPLLGPDSSKFNKDSKCYETNLEEIDIILGTKEKLSAVVSRAIDEIGPRKILVFNNTCVPVVSGEDVSSLVASSREKCPVPMFYEGPENSISINPYNEFFVNLKNNGGFMERELIAKSVNLIGFPGGKAFEEITTVLNEMGVIVNSCFLPEIDPGIFENYRAAALTVFYPDDAYSEIYERIFGDVPVRTINPPAPYGISGTRKWLECLAAELGIEEEERLKTISKVERASLDEWPPLAQEALKHAIGFVLSGGGAEIITRPGVAGGVPLLNLIREMGFGTRFFYYRNVGHRISLPGKTPNIKGVEMFSTPEELEKLMLDSPAECFYSDFYFDQRLVNAGKGQFSLQFFEMGFSGAVRSLKRLVDACSVPFFSRYMKYLR